MRKQIKKLVGKMPNPDDAKFECVKITPQPGLKQPLLKGITPPSQLVDANDCVYLRYYCSQCEKPLHKTMRITLENKYFCVTCFCKNEKIAQDSMAEYTVNSHWNFPILDQTWPAEHQILLLSGIEKNGFGNWQAIKEYMECCGAKYNTDQLQEHYDKYYGNQYNQNLALRFLPGIDKYPLPLKRKKSLIKHQKNTANTEQYQYLSPSNPNNSFSNPKNNKKVGQLVCFNEKRNQFFTPFNDKLEKYIAELEFKENDTEQEYQIKMKILEQYNMGLLDRYQKQKMIKEHRLLDHGFLSQRDRFLEADQYATHSSVLVKPFMRYVNCQQYQNLVNSTAFCLQIQAMISALKSIKEKQSQTKFISLSCDQKVVQSEIIDPEQMGQPRKRVHKNPESYLQNAQQTPKMMEQDKNSQKILSEIGLTNSELLLYLRNMKETAMDQDQNSQKQSEEYRNQFQKIVKVSRKIQKLGIKVERLKTAKA